MIMPLCLYSKYPLLPVAANSERFHLGILQSSCHAENPLLEAFQGNRLEGWNKINCNYCTHGSLNTCIDRENKKKIAVQILHGYASSANGNVFLYEKVKKTDGFN